MLSDLKQLVHHLYLKYLKQISHSSTPVFISWISIVGNVSCISMFLLIIFRNAERERKVQIILKPMTPKYDDPIVRDSLVKYKNSYMKTHQPSV